MYLRRVQQVGEQGQGVQEGKSKDERARRETQVCREKRARRGMYVCKERARVRGEMRKG